ncbi:MAG: hypothetical protein NT075_31950, partial [Chloroflexi bacterium]|nr:hypothetical protein [Chloroflexota bacterium]
MKTSSKSSYLRFVLTMLFLLQAVPSDTAKAVTSRAMGIGQQLSQAQATIAQVPPDAALPPSPRQLYLPLLANGLRASVTTTDKLATPLLIKQAFERGEITAAEQALYLAYALYEPQSLPAPFHSNVG